MAGSSRRRMTVLAGTALGVLTWSFGMPHASGATFGPTVAPMIATVGTDTAPESSSTPLNLTVWLNLHDRAALDARVTALYDRSSPNYHHWLTKADLQAYMPTAAEVATMRQQLAGYGVKVTSVSPFNLGLRISGSTAQVEAAFHTAISRTTVSGRLVHVSSSRPQLAGAAASLFAGLGGIDGGKPEPLLRFPFDARTKQALMNLPASAAAPSATGPSAGPCFTAPTTVSLSGVNEADGTTPTSATISGLAYGSIAGSTSGGPPCGYSPAEVRSFYGMQAAYNAGYDGTGQTIVVVDAFLEPEAETDGNMFNSLYGLPAFTAGNFTAYAPDGGSLTGAQESISLVEETDLDVEWSHAIAPGAKIALVQAFSDDEEDIQTALLYAVQNHLGNVISLSYGEPESLTSPTALNIFNTVAELAAASGISLQVSSGDSGDYTTEGISADVNGWGSSPYDTVVGGTSVATNPSDGSLITVGWGNNINELGGDFGTGATLIADPPTGTGEFYGGSGGGASRVFAKPAYQASLPGTQRLMPDVSALADPFTGAEFVFSEGALSVTTPIGGTSLASPIVSAMWAIYNQLNAAPAGQAAAFVAAAPPSVIRDVVPFNGPANVTDTVTDPTGTTSYGAAQIANPLFTTALFASAIWNDSTPGTTPFYVNVTFGTDTSLQTATGWDDVTGYGTPNVAAALGLLGGDVASTR